MKTETSQPERQTVKVSSPTKSHASPLKAHPAGLQSPVSYHMRADCKFIQAKEIMDEEDSATMTTNE